MKTCAVVCCRIAAAFFAVAGTGALLAGCNIGGFITQAVGGNGQMIQASYKGLAGQKCGVIVWADDGVINDYRSLQLDTARGLQIKLEEAAKVKVKEVLNITWVPPEQLLEYQENHTDMSGEAAEVLAPQLGLSRLIYIEIQQFDMHPANSPDLWRGTMTANVEVVEITDGKAKVTYAERGVTVISPKNCPIEGLPDMDDATLYSATLDTFTGELGKRFVPHEADAGADPSPSDVQE